jgi:uncharacterized protein YjcR
MATHSYEFGALYRGTVRDLHRQANVPIRETKLFLSSRFYVDDTTEGERALLRAINQLLARIRAFDEAEAAKEATALRLQAEKEAAARLRRINRWRMLTFRRPLPSLPQE